ncbi:hypothetical protein D3C77_219830 [compost metagenome]
MGRACLHNPEIGARLEAAPQIAIEQVRVRVVLGCIGIEGCEVEISEQPLVVDVKGDAAVMRNRRWGVAAYDRRLFVRKLSDLFHRKSLIHRLQRRVVQEGGWPRLRHLIEPLVSLAPDVRSPRFIQSFNSAVALLQPAMPQALARAAHALRYMGLELVVELPGDDARQGADGPGDMLSNDRSPLAEIRMIGAGMLPCPMLHHGTMLIHVHPLRMAVAKPDRRSRRRRAHDRIDAMLVQKLYHLYK